MAHHVLLSKLLLGHSTHGVFSCSVGQRKSRDQPYVNGVEMYNPPTGRDCHILNNYTLYHVSKVSGLSNWWVVVVTVMQR